MVGYEAVFALFCALRKAAVSSVVARCSWTLAMYLYGYDGRLLGLIEIYQMYEWVNWANFIRKTLKTTNNLQTNTILPIKTKSGKYFKLNSQFVKVILDLQDAQERVFYMTLIQCSFFLRWVEYTLVNKNKYQSFLQGMVKLSLVVLIGILLLSCILDFIFWCTRSKHTTWRLVVTYTASCLQESGVFKLISNSSLKDVSLQLKSPEDVILQAKSFEDVKLQTSSIRIALELWLHQQRALLIDIRFVMVVLELAVCYALRLFLHLPYFLRVVHELYNFEEHALVDF